MDYHPPSSSRPPRPRPLPTAPRRFALHREHDPTGVSGTGVVADGVQFGDGECVLRWRGDKASTVIYSNISDLLAVHGHNGSTHVHWVDTQGLAIRVLAFAVRQRQQHG